MGQVISMANKDQRNTMNFLARVLSILLPSGLFGLILSIKIPDSLARFQNQHWFLNFIILVILFYLCFRSRGKWGWAIGFGLVMALFALQLASKWSLGISNANIIGGFLPYKDSFYYYNGSRMLLAGQAIAEEGLQGAFRPLFPGMLSVLLLFTQHNLIWVIATVVFLVALCSYLAAQALKDSFGPLPAAVLMVLLYSFIRPMIGYTLTELPSLIFSCLAFFLLLKGAESKKYSEIALGSLMLVIAISVRAGPFFMLPMLVLWIGWAFRSGNKLPLKQMALFTLLLAAEFLAVNIIFPRLVTTTSSSTFGNFSWMLYGQAVGGAGWTYHFQALGTNDPGVVMQAAIEKIRTYPLGLMIGTIKSYRDFFLPGQTSMFNLISYRQNIFNNIFWVLNFCLMVLGLVHSIRHINKPKYSLLFSCFLGIFFSIPFLPPVDGGNRFYTGSIPFFFALEAVGLFSILSTFGLTQMPKKKLYDQESKWIMMISLIMAALILIASIGVKLTQRLPTLTIPDCPSNQVPYAIQLYTGMYVDILPSTRDKCGTFPVLCLDDFEKNGADKNNDEFFQKLVELTNESKDGIRVSASVNLISFKYNFTIFPLNLIPVSNSGPLYTGCAEKIKTQFQNILLVKTHNP